MGAMDAISENEIRKVSKDSPYRCQHSGKLGQCTNETVIVNSSSGKRSKYCAIHFGNRDKSIAEKRELRNYRIELFHERISELSYGDQLKHIGDEIAILRMIIESILQKCKTPTDLFIHGNRISDLTMKVNTLVTSLVKIEEKTANYLDQDNLQDFVQKVIITITNNVNDSNTIEKIAEEMFVIIEEMGVR